MHVGAEWVCAAGEAGAAEGVVYRGPRKILGEILELGVDFQ